MKVLIKLHLFIGVTELELIWQFGDPTSSFLNLNYLCRCEVSYKLRAFMRDEHRSSRDSIKHLKSKRRQVIEQLRLVAEIANQWKLLVDFVVKLQKLHRAMYAKVVKAITE